MMGNCSVRRRNRRGGSAEGSSSTCNRSRTSMFRSAARFGRLCGVGDDEDSSEDEENFGTWKANKATRHAIDSEIPNQSISHLYNPDDNYEPHPTNPTLRSPKSLTELCVDALCRSLPDLNGELPPHLPQDVVDRIVKSLTAHAALNCTTMRALSNCELGTLCLADARGVNDEFLMALCSSGSFGHRDRSASIDHSGGIPDSPDLVGNSSAHSSSLIELDSMELDELDEAVDSEDYDSRSTSSFVSAYSSPFKSTGGIGDPGESSPLLPSVLPPPEFFSLSSPSSTTWLKPIARGPLIQPQMPAPLQYRGIGASQGNGSPTFGSGSLSFPINNTTASLTLLDLRGSQRMSDRGLIQLASSPLLALEVAKLDNCHGITGKGMLAFSRSPRLHTISLANCRRLTDEAVVNISHCTSLTSLNVGGCRCLTDRSLEAMSGLLDLRRLDLSQCDLITDDGLIFLGELDLLEELSLGWCRLISDYGLKIISEQRNRSIALKTLRLARCAITNDGLDYLEQLQSLEDLDINGCSLSSTALGESLEKLTNLNSLDASHCPGILRSSWQGKINNLKSLELCYSVVKDSHIARLSYLPNLQELNLDSCLIGDWAIAHLVDNDVVPGLEVLNLADTQISDNAMSKVAKLAGLRSLSLFYCNVSSRGLRHLASLEKLDSLNLDSRDIGDEGLRYLRNLPLKSLDLFSSRVTDLGCSYIAKIKTLTTLQLAGGGVGDLGCAHIATIDALESLNLSQNESITNRGAASLAALSNLRALNLSNTRVTSNALKFFHGLSKLQSLALYGCIMEDSPIESLQDEVPTLRCLRLNNANDNDGVIGIGHDYDSEDSDEEYYEDELGGEADDLSMEYHDAEES
mmetsp:Transcript_38432/g.86545  ORF Transcript_38432/g.86545 Transcript_38432/m.86545 type:complete len:862 (-) Transcript_38432:78-2663(-)